MIYCSLYRREVWEKAGGYNGNMKWGYEDWDFWIGCGEQGLQFARLPEPLFFYRVKENSMFTSALKHDLKLRAQIVLNHPRAYNETTRKWASQIIKEDLAAEAVPHDILARKNLLAKLRSDKAYFEKEITHLRKYIVDLEKGKQLAWRHSGKLLGS